MTRRGALTAAVALAAVALANAWVGARLPVLLQDTTVSEVLEVERRAKAFPRERVLVLIIGNSHALAGLRPPVVAAALGLAPESVFSFALPSSSPQEMHLLLQRNLASFPNVKLVLANVDEYFLGAHVELRSRYLTSGKLVERARFAAEHPPEEWLRLMSGTWLPVLDFGATLHASLREHPRHTLRALVQEVPILNPYNARVTALPYRWGYPPPWDFRPERALRALALKSRSPRGLANRAAQFLSAARRAPLGAQALGKLTADLGARGLPLLLVETPYSPPLDAELRRQDPAVASGWRSAIDSLPPAERPARVPALLLPLSAFYDADHLTPAGAGALARHVAAAPALQSRFTAQKRK